jgi:nuclear protein localization family protein 4
MFENGQIVERFLNYWRRTGNQRVGFLYGRYEPYESVPLGIRAVVSAIYEPPQTTNDSSVELHLPDPNQERIELMAKLLGLKCVGWMFTDLVSDDIQKGTVKHFRGNSNSFFLSAEECITAGYLQNMFKNYTKFSSDGHFGSKFVTVVVTGDATNQIHFEGYQVSNQCCSLVRDGCIVPTLDVPQLAYIRESSNDKFIPDVYYREKDNYNNEVTKIGRPLPVEYLIVDLPAAFAKEAVYMFNESGKSSSKTSFPIENRADIGEAQDFVSLKAYMKQFAPTRFIDAMSDFHLLIFLITNQTVHFDVRISFPFSHRRLICIFSFILIFYCRM